MDDNHAKIHALLDAFAALDTRNAHLFLHEENDHPMADAVIAWAKAHGVRITTNISTSHGRTYETWELLIRDSAVSFFPLKMGLLDDIDSLKKKIDAVRREADERIREFVEAEKAKAGAP